MVEIPATYKVALKVAEGGNFCFEVKQIPIPKVPPDQVLVRLAATGVCGTDFALASGKLGPHRDVLGHEGIGYVVKVGSEVSKTQVEVGHRACIPWVRDICQKCVYCLTPGEEPRCVEQLNSGRKIDGCFAEYALVPTRYLVRIPDQVNLSNEEIAPILCGGVTAYKAIKSSGAQPGEWIAVSGGGGGVGALGIQYARAMGLRPIAIDAGEDKKQLCLDSGAEAYINVLKEQDIPTTMATITDDKLGVRTVIVTAGSPKAYETAVEILGPMGTLVCVGIPPPTQPFPVHPLSFIDKGIRIIGSFVGTREDILEAIQYVERGEVKPAIRLAELGHLNEIRENFGTNTEKYVIQF